MARDVVELIMQDHREMERMFDQMRSDPDKRAMLLPVMSSTLLAHARAEESEVYPAAREEGGQEDDVEHGQQEHLAAELALKDLQEIDPYAAEFVPALEKLVEAVTHHVEEEESDLLPGMRQHLSVERLDELAEAFLAARASHLGTEAGTLSRSELEVQAANLGMESTSSLSKEQLQRKIESQADE